MTHRLSLLSFIAIAAASLTIPAIAHESKSSPSAAASPSVVPKTAADVVDGFHAALKRGDTGTASSLLNTDALIFESGGVERGKAEYASHHLAADAAFAAATTHNVIRRSGAASGDFAWIATEGRTTGTYKERPVDSVSTETMLLRRTSGIWQIVHIHWSSAKTK